MPAGVTFSASDFQFKVGNTSNSSTWSTGPAPTAVATWTGTNGDTFADIVWANNAIQEEWLQVTVLADTNTHLASNFMFYYGSEIGATGISTATTGNGPVIRVTSADVVATQNNASLLQAVPITNLVRLQPRRQGDGRRHRALPEQHDAAGRAGIDHRRRKFRQHPARPFQSRAPPEPPPWPRSRGRLRSLRMHRSPTAQPRTRCWSVQTTTRSSESRSSTGNHARGGPHPQWNLHKIFPREVRTEIGFSRIDGFVAAQMS